LANADRDEEFRWGASVRGILVFLGLVESLLPGTAGEHRTGWLTGARRCAAMQFFHGGKVGFVYISPLQFFHGAKVGCVYISRRSSRLCSFFTEGKVGCVSVGKAVIHFNKELKNVISATTSEMNRMQ